MATLLVALWVIGIAVLGITGWVMVGVEGGALYLLLAAPFGAYVWWAAREAPKRAQRAAEALLAKIIGE